MIEDLHREVSDAVQWYWETRRSQGAEQRQSDNTARGERAKVLGGGQMDGFAGLVEDIIVSEAGVPRSSVKHDYHATLPGYYRHEKEWDTAVVHEGELLAAVEYKSQASSFGNNLNNRTEEALGSNTDLIRAYEEGLFAPSPQPWIGYLFLMADVEESREAKSLREPNFDADDAFKNASYVDRMEILLTRMVRQRLVDNAAFILSDPDRGASGEYWEPNEELEFGRFARSLAAQVAGNVDIQGDLDE